MKKKIVLLTLLFVKSFIGMAQSYTSLITKANKSYQEKDFEKSQTYFKEAFAIKKVNPNDLYTAGCAAALAGKKKDAVSYINDAIANGYLDLEHIQKDSDLTIIHQDVNYLAILANFKKQASITESKYDIPLKIKLEKVFKEDQDLRGAYLSNRAKFGTHSASTDSIANKILHVDSMNVKLVTQILDSSGWVGPKTVGIKANQALFLVIQHSSLEIQKRYLPLLRDAVLKNDASPSWLALLEDRIAIREKRKQIYGSQISTEGGRNHILPLSDPDNVDKRRREVGLEPLSEYLQRWKIDWNVEEYKKQERSEN